MTLLMMGSAEALPEEPLVRPTFMEDMTEEQLASAVSPLSPLVKLVELLPLGTRDLGSILTGWKLHAVSATV